MIPRPVRAVRPVQPRGIALERSRWREAPGDLRRSLAGSAPADSIVRKLHAMIARAYQALGEPEAAQLWAEVLAECPGDREAEAVRGRLAASIGG